jgi:hypothetical protein
MTQSEVTQLEALASALSEITEGLRAETAGQGLKWNEKWGIDGNNNLQKICRGLGMAELIVRDVQSQDGGCRAVS